MIKSTISKPITFSVYDLMGTFPNEKTAREHFEKVRWKGQPVCPRCNSNFRQYARKSPERVGYFLCKNCGKEYTVRTGTVFERSHIPLHKWFLAMHLVDDSRKGISSVQLSKALGIIQRSSWFLQQRMRETFSDGKMNLLKNEVEADEAHFGGLEKNKHASKKLNAGRGAVGKTPVLGIRERNGNVKGIVLKDTSAKTIQGELNKWVDKDATLYTDEHSAYKNNKFNHKTVNHSTKEYVNNKAHTNSIESYWALLKRGHYGTHYHFSPKHLQRYVDEFAYRLNDNNRKRGSMEKLDALLIKSTGKRLTYNDLKNSQPTYLKENGQYEMIKSVLKKVTLYNLMENAPLNKSVKTYNINNSKDVLAEAKVEKPETNNSEKKANLK